MAEQTKKRVPQVRFKGFSDEWDDKPIGEVLTEKKRQIELEDNELYELVTVRRRNGGVDSRGHLQGKDILVKNYSQLRAGDFIISKRQVVHGATGIVPQYLDKAIVSNEYLVAVGNENISSEFLTIISTLPDMYRKFFLSSYGVDIEKLFFDAADWKKRNVVLPKLPEQNEICSYFAEIDQIIGLHLRKHEKLLTLKKAMLKKMFPQNGATTPEIRFKGFSQPWEERQFDEIVFRVTSSSAASDLPRVEYEDIVSGYGLLNKNIFKKLSCKNGIEFDEEDVLFGKLRPYLKNWLCADFKGIAVGDFWVLRAIEADAGFVYLLIQTEAFEDIANQSAGSKMPRSDWKLVSKSFFSVPVEIHEQQKIGTYFRQMDELIAQHGTQVEKLQQIKTACLEKMFV